MFHYLWPSERFDFKLTRRGLSFAFKCVGLCACTYRDLGFFYYLIIYLRWHHIKEDSCSISSTTNDSGSSSAIHFVLPQCAGKIYIRPTIHLAVHWMSCCDIFFM